MLKHLFVLVALLTVAFSQTDKQIIQSLLDGVYTQNKLPNSTTIVPCIDDASAHKIVVFIGEILDKASKGSLSDLLALPNLVKDFQKSLDPAVGTCLDGNVEVDALSAALGVKDADSSALEKRAISYVTLHYLSVHKSLGDADSAWHAAKYYDTGFKLSSLAHQILGTNFAVVAEELQHILESGKKIMKLLNLRSEVLNFA